MDLIGSLIQYVKDVKPYHTKIYGIDIEYRAYETINVSFTEKFMLHCFMGIPYKQPDNELRWDLNGSVLNQLDMGLAELNYDDYFDIDRSNTITVNWFNVPETWYSETELSNMNQLVTSWIPQQVNSPLFKNSGLVYENIHVRFTEKIRFYNSRNTADIDDADIILFNPWDFIVDGIPFVSKQLNSFSVAGNWTTVLSNLSTVEIINNGINDGVYTIVTNSYNVNENTTTINISGILNPNIVGGKWKIGSWDGLDESLWDGKILFPPQPEADINATTTFEEKIIIATGNGWDDPSDGGWDNLPFDYANVIISGSSKHQNSNISTSIINMPTGLQWYKTHSLLKINEWNNLTPSLTNNWRTVRISKTGTIICISLSNYVELSTDNGNNWIAINDPIITTETIVDLATDNEGTWVAVTLNNVIVSYDDGVVWSYLTPSTLDSYIPSTSFTAVSYGNGKWILLASNGTGLISDNTIDWDDISSNGLNLNEDNGIYAFSAVHMNKFGKCVALTSWGYGSVSVDNGNNFRGIPSLHSGVSWKDITCNKFNQWVAVASTNEIARSEDGYVWQYVTPQNIYGSWTNVVTDGEDIFIATSLQGNIIISLNAGKTWSLMEQPDITDLYSSKFICCNEQTREPLFVGVTSSGHRFTNINI